jgi:hypothetical protein
MLPPSLRGPSDGQIANGTLSTIRSLSRRLTYLILVPGAIQSASFVMSNHLSTPVVSADRSRCNFCEKRLPIIMRLFGSEFCSPSHRSAYARRQQEMFLARLHMRDHLVSDSPIPTPSLRKLEVATATIDAFDFSSFIKC